MKAYCRDVWVFFHVFSLSKLRLLSFQTHKRAWSWIFLRHENTFAVIIFPFWLSSEIPRLREHLWLFRGDTWSAAAAAIFYLCTERRVFDSKSRQRWPEIQHPREQQQRVDAHPTLNEVQKAKNLTDFTFRCPDDGICIEILNLSYFKK